MRGGERILVHGDYDVDGICATTFLVWYLTVDNSLVHGMSMFATTLFLFLWHRFRRVPTRARWA